MNLIETVKAKAKANPVKVAFPEANDVKMISAISEVVNEKYCTAYIVGNNDEVKSLCKENNIDDSNWNYVDISDEDYKDISFDTYKVYLNSAYSTEYSED